MRAVAFIAPGPIDAKTGGYVYNRQMADGLLRQGWSVIIRELDESFPYPTPTALQHAAGVLAAIPRGTLVIVDGLAFGAMPSVVEREASRLRLVALIHLPLGAEVGLDQDAAARLAATERRALAAASLVIFTGAAARPVLEGYGIRRDTMVLVEPGTEPAPIARGTGRRPLRLLTVATLNPGKGHEILLRALATISNAEWHLTCAGSMTRHPETADRVRALVGRLNLTERVSLVGELEASDLATCYDEADLFVLATLKETYGMAVAEALAHGLPVVSTTTGAIPDLVGTEAGLLVPPGDIGALAEALAHVLGDAGFRARLAEGARRVRDRLRTWDQAVDNMAAALARLETHG